MRNGKWNVRIPHSAFRISAAFALLLSLAMGSRAATATDTWAQVTKKIVIQPGTATSCWKDVSRSLVTNGETNMVAVGDGTYELIIGLTAGQTYNYIIYANAGSPAPGGLSAFNEYYDIMPTTGIIKCSTNGSTVNDTTSARYSSVAYDARRVLTVPSTLNPGDTLWVFNNFGETPGVVTNFTAWPEGETQIRLNWGAPYGFWGQNGEAFKAADVLAGGHYRVFRSNTTETGAYTQVDTVQGNILTYLDTNLTPGTYYYVIRCYDAYQGKVSLLTDSFSQLRSDTSSPESSTTAGKINAFFLVRGADWSVIEQKQGQVWLSDPQDPPWGPKFVARIVRVYLPRRM